MGRHQRLDGIFFDLVTKVLADQTELRLAGTKVTDLTPLQAMWAAAPTMAIADGVDEVHKVTVARNVLRDYEPHPGLWPTEYIPARREEARKKYADLIAADPDMAAWADAAVRGRRTSPGLSSPLANTAGS